MSRLHEEGLSELPFKRLIDHETEIGSCLGMGPQLRPLNPPHSPAPECVDRIHGLLLGTAVGDALGLPLEGLPPAVIQRRWPGPLRMHFAFGRGMLSDDTEHTLMVATSLLQEFHDPVRFQKALGWKIRWWLLALPGGVGWATARAGLKLWLGFPAARSGVCSAGNGPAMRSALLGACFAGDRDRRHAFVRASTRVTHTDPRAEIAALAVAETAAHLAQHPGKATAHPPALLSELAALSQEAAWQNQIEQIDRMLLRGGTVREFAASLGCQNGVSGYAWHTVPAALYAFLRHPGDFRSALEEVIRCGGDTDTAGAIVGALAGTAVGPEGIPREWRERIWDYPRTVGYIRRIAQALAEQLAGAAPTWPSLPWPLAACRNLLFLVAVLAHGFRRMLPPHGRKKPGEQ